MEYAVIMAGGRGTRLWPFSRNDRPKQLLPIVRGKSLLQLSYERLRALLPAERIFVCTGASHRATVLQNLPDLPPDNVLGEPEGRDTANAIEPKALVTFGLIPTHGHTGLGYIHRGEALTLKSGSKGAYRVMKFVEKPAKPDADRFVESGRYYWNSGMFVWRCDTVLNELAIHLPMAYAGLSKIGQAWDTPDAQRVLQENYPALTKKSIDYAVMEPASQGKGKAHVVVVEMPVQWLDVGSWPALSETLATDDHDNAVEAGNCVLVDSFNNIVVSNDPQHLVALLGVSDMIVVHTTDATLVCPKTEDQRVKELVDRVKDKTGGRYQ